MIHSFGIVLSKMHNSAFINIKQHQPFFWPWNQSVMLPSLEWCEMCISNKCRPTDYCRQLCTSISQVWGMVPRWIGKVASQVDPPRFCWNDATGTDCWWEGHPAAKTLACFSFSHGNIIGTDNLRRCASKWSLKMSLCMQIWILRLNVLLLH